MAINFYNHGSFQWTTQATSGTAGTSPTFVSPSWYDDTGTSATTSPSQLVFDFNGSALNQTVGSYRFSTIANTQSTITFTDWSTGIFGGKLYELKNALMDIFKGPNEKLWKDLTEDEKKMFKAKKTSEKLLKRWLSTNEWKALKEKGEIEIPAIDEKNCIYIVRKDPNARVIVKKDGRRDHELCVVSKDLELPVGDQLLSKILLVKHNQKKFKELGVKYN